jgi:uncharacterized protein YukE
MTGAPLVDFRGFSVQIGGMQQAIIDPEQVRRFAEELQRFNRDVQHRLSSLQARFGALGDSWQDQEHEKFSEEFRQTVKALKKFVEMSDQHVPYLMRKVQRIEDYLKQR